MFFKITGLLWIALGIWWLMRPQSIRKRFSKKLKRSRKKVLFLVIILIAGLFFSVARHTHGVLANIFLIASILGIVKGVFILTSKASDRIIDWWLARPLWMWRI